MDNRPQKVVFRFFPIRKSSAKVFVLRIQFTKNFRILKLLIILSFKCAAWHAIFKSFLQFCFFILLTKDFINIFRHSFFNLRYIFIENNNWVKIIFIEHSHVYTLSLLEDLNKSTLEN